MKTNLWALCVLMCLSSCIDSVEIDAAKNIEKELEDPLLLDDKDLGIEKFDGLEGKLEMMKRIPTGHQLTYNGNGVWYGNFAGSGVYFYGPTPAEIQSGVASAWTAAPGPVCNGCIVYGNGDHFLVQQPGCAGGVALKFVLMVKRTKSPQSGDINWEVVQKATVKVGGTDCTIQAYGKIVIDDECKPLIVTTDSESNDTCNANPDITVV